MNLQSLVRMLLAACSHENQRGFPLLRFMQDFVSMFSLDLPRLRPQRCREDRKGGVQSLRLYSRECSVRTRSLRGRVKAGQFWLLSASGRLWYSTFRSSHLFFPAFSSQSVCIRFSALPFANLILGFCLSSLSPPSSPCPCRQTVSGPSEYSSLTVTFRGKTQLALAAALLNLSSIFSLKSCCAFCSAPQSSGEGRQLAMQRCSFLRERSRQSGFSILLTKIITTICGSAEDDV